MKWLAGILLLVLLALQFRLWLSEDGVREVARLAAVVEAQRAENDRLAQRNSQLAAEVQDLKSGMAALEERARSELGMIARNETFFQVVPARATRSLAPASEPRTQTAAR
jgi:cell division protein FtsB